MAGYWKNPASTTETIKDGWLYTGDMGYMGKDGLLYVLGRFKSLLIGSDGEKYSPEGIEEALVEHSSCIDQLLLYNNQNPYTVALVVPNKDHLKRHLSHLQLDLNTEKGKEEAIRLIEETGLNEDRVLVVYLPDCHESLAGIVAGRIREAYYRPTLVVTRSEHGAKGSGRSIESYSMYEELCKCEEYLTQFGGHPMAAGFSLKEADIDAFRRKLNEACTLTEEELRPKVVIDVPMPISYITERLVNQLGCLEPFGKGNEKPVFADRNLVIERLRICGKEGRVFQMKVRNAAGVSMDAVYFGDAEDLLLPLTEKYGKVVAQDTLAGRCVHEAALHFTYYPEMDHYYETPRIKLRLTGVSV